MLLPRKPSMLSVLGFLFVIYRYHLFYGTYNLRIKWLVARIRTISQIK